MRAVVVNTADTNTCVEGVAEAARALRDGALVIFPTETVYGVAANAAHPGAMRRLRDLKAGNNQRPFTVHLGRRSDARLFVRSPSPLLRRLTRKSWPGPLTLIAEEPDPAQTEMARSCSPEQLREVFFENTVGLRCPDHPVAARLLADANAPIVASSANLPGRPPPVDLESALKDLDGLVEYALDAGRTQYNVASTILEVRGNAWTLRRAGSLDERTIRRLARSEVLFVCTGNSCRSPMAEALFRHKLAQRLGLSPEALAEAGYAVSSAGTHALPGGQASRNAVDEMARRGLDLHGHRSQPLTVEVVQRAERIYVMSPEHLEAARALAPGRAADIRLLDPGRPVADPIGGGPDEYRRCAGHIEQALDARLTEFVNEDLDW